METVYAQNKRASSVRVDDQAVEPVKESLSVLHVCREVLNRRMDVFERSATAESEDLDLESLTAKVWEVRGRVERKFDRAGSLNSAG